MRASLKIIRDFMCRAVFPLRESEELIENTSIEDLRALISLQEVVCEGISIIALLPYRLPLVQACMLEAKFHHNAHAYELLGSLLAEFLTAFAHEHEESGIVLVPVPLGAKRRKERGYNQVAEITKVAIQKLESLQFILAQTLLTRTRNTKPQMELGRAERLTNVCGAFLCTRSKLPEHLIYVVLDDVVTTGATLTSATAALRADDASRIFCISLAH